MWKYYMPCTYITDMYVQEPLKFMVGSMSFHGDAWSIDASVREVLQCHGCHQLPSMEFMIGSCMQLMHDHFNHQTVMRCKDGLSGSIHVIWGKAKLKQSCQKVAKGRHPIEQVLVLAHGSCKLATCSHPVQGHNGAAILTDEPSNCKPPASAHPGRPFMIACHESGTLVWGWSRMYVYILIMSASAHASFKGMLQHVGKQFLVRKLEL